MARGVNKVILIGNIGKIDKFDKNGSIIVKVSMATSEKYKDKNTGEVKENTEWHNVVFFGKLAEIAGAYIEKGGQIYVEGKIRTNKYIDEAGTERYSTQIVAETMQLLGKKREGDAKPSAPPVAAYEGLPKPYEKDDFFNDTIPF